MKKWKIALWMLTAMCMAGGCGKEEGASMAVQNKDYVYKFESFSDKLKGHDFGQSVATKDRLIFMEYRYEEGQMPEAKIENAAEDGVAEADVPADMSADMPVEDFYTEEVEPQKSFIRFVQYDFDWNLLAEFEIEQSDSCGFNGMAVDDNGNIYTVFCEYSAKIDASGVYKDINTLVGYSATGEELFRRPLGEDIGTDEYYYVNSILCTDENVVLWSTDRVEVYSFAGEEVKKLKVDSSEYGQMYKLRDGSLVSLCYGENNMYFVRIDLETGETSERIEVPYNGNNFIHYAGTYCDFMLTDSNGVYTYNLGEEEPQKIMDFVDSDLSTGSVYSVLQLSEDSFFAWTYDEVSYESICGIFNKVDPSTIKDKEILTLGTIWMDTDVRKRVVEFNKTNEEYRIRVEEYSRYNTADDYTVGLSRLNTDIASGNAPDIMCLTGDMPVGSYMSKGLFVDLNTFLEKDAEFNAEDYMQEVMDAFSQNGKWYQLVPSYHLYTVLGKTADVGEQAGLTFEKLQSLRAKKGADVQIFSERTKTSVLNDAIMMNSDEYINWETGECYFNTPQFISLLEFANEFPGEIDYETLYNDPNYWEKQETLFRDGRALLQPYTIASFQDFQYCEDGMFGEQITAVGFPVHEGVGNAYMCNLSLAISAKSKHQDAAWSFLRYYLTDEYQDSLEYGWPLKLSSLEKRVQAAQKKPFYEDENGNKVEYDDTYYIGGMEIKLEPLSKEDCDRVISFLKSADYVYSYDKNILTILEEEAAAYFNGQKTVKEVADIIQSRIHIYVNENL